MTVNKDDLITTRIRMMNTADIHKCPHTIFLPRHYRADGSCKCNDPENTEMAQWGYAWNDTAKSWIAPRNRG